MHLKGECIACPLSLSLSELVVHVVRDILLSMRPPSLPLVSSLVDVVVADGDAMDES